LSKTNALAYFSPQSVKKEKSFIKRSVLCLFAFSDEKKESNITLRLGANFIKLYLA